MNRHHDARPLPSLAVITNCHIIRKVEIIIHTQPSRAHGLNELKNGRILKFLLYYLGIENMSDIAEIKTWTTVIWLTWQP